MKFAHLADCHIGGWREPELRELGLRAFERAVDICIEEHVGFVLIAGDLFDTALPSIEVLKEVARILNKLKENDVSVYAIAGSHDFSVSGKTMLDVLEKAGLVENVMKVVDGESGEEKFRLAFTEDKTGVKIVGMLGRKGGLEVRNYEILDRGALEREAGDKIFMFHTAVEEFKPEEMRSVKAVPLSLFPRGFSYYAGGHVHRIFSEDKKAGGYGLINFPGALFPNNFKELEDFGAGGFYIVELGSDGKFTQRYVEVKLKDVVARSFDASGKKPEDVEREIVEGVKPEDCEGKILLLRVGGKLKQGKPSDVRLGELMKKFEGAHVVLRNTAKLSSEEFEIGAGGEDEEGELGDVDEIEKKLFAEALGGVESESGDGFGEEIAMKLVEVLSKEKGEGERKFDYEGRLVKEVWKVLGLGLEFGSVVVEGEGKEGVRGEGKGEGKEGVRGEGKGEGKEGGRGEGKNKNVA